MLPTERGRHTRPAKPNRMMVNGMLRILRTGALWRDLPDHDGPWQSVYTRYSRWTLQGIWQRVLHEVAKDFDDGAWMIDPPSYEPTRTRPGSNGGALRPSVRLVVA